MEVTLIILRSEWSCYVVLPCVEVPCDAGHKTHADNISFPRPHPLPCFSDYLLQRRMYRAWLAEPSSVHTSWQAYFKGLDGGLPSSQAFSMPPDAGAPLEGTGSVTMPPTSAGNTELTDHLKVSGGFFSVFFFLVCLGFGLAG